MKSSVAVVCFFFHYVFGLFEQCNHNIYLERGEKLFINSPYYPGNYPLGTSCRYVVTVPGDCRIKFKCDINMKMPPGSTRCLNEVFYFNREGSELSTDSEYFCGSGVIERTSFLNQAVISYISTPANTRYLLSADEVGESDKGQTTIEMETGTTTTTTSTSTEQPLPLDVEQEFTTTKTTITSGEMQSEEPPKPLTSLSTLSTSKLTSLKPPPLADTSVSNSFAYVVALLSNNKLGLDLFGTQTPIPAQSVDETTLALPELFGFETSKPTSAFDFHDFLPVDTWRKGDSRVIHKMMMPSERAPKVVVGQDYTSPVVTPLGKGGGGMFSCLIEVTEPTCDCGWGSTLKIAGVSGVAGVNEFPSMAGIVSTMTQKIFCGAAIIHRRYLLSSAHCFMASNTNRPEYLRAIVGEHDIATVLESIYTRSYDISKIIVHEYFRSTATTVHNDIALLKTRTAIEWNRSVGPACLPFLPIRGFDGSRKPPQPGQRVETAGWGTTAFGGQQSSVLLKTTLDVISREQCQKFLHYMATGTFCTFTPGTDTCQYDSGGALYIRGDRIFAVGIVSYGYACATYQPSINTRVASYLKWIRSKTPEVKYCIK